mmetsp:Transcript_28554/g.67433  ORF Transcript_28554/g.67433 Transcript_28554/m.67433 type:complete len:229 (+) Transcript_28554:183-869(+)
MSDPERAARVRGGANAALISDFLRPASTDCLDSSTACTFLLRCSKRLLSSARCFRCSLRRPSMRFSSAASSACCCERNLLSRCWKIVRRSSSSLARSRRSISSAIRLIFCASAYFFCFASISCRCRQSSSSRENLGGRFVSSSCSFSWNSRNLTAWRSLICWMYICAMRSYSSMYLSHASLNSAYCMLWAIWTSWRSASWRALSALCCRFSSCLRNVSSWLAARPASR